MAYHSDNVATAIDDQQSNRQIHLSRYGARPANYYSSVQIDQSCTQDRHDPICDLDHSVLLPMVSYRRGGFLTPESFSATSPSAAARSYTSDEANVNMRKERRRAQNRVAQRAFRDRKEKAIKSLSNELQRLITINQNLSEANEAYARQISELKETIESAKRLETPTSSALTRDTSYDLDILGFELGFEGRVASLQVDGGDSWIYWPEGERAMFREAKTQG